MVKIAVASTDGKVVNEHFGRADRFYILEADEESGTYRLLEIRERAPVCQGGDHEETQMQDAVKCLLDCRIVLVSRIGARARDALEAAGLDVYEIPGIISESVERLIRFRKAEALFDGY